MNPRTLGLAASLTMLALAACGQPAADEDKAFGARVRAYLLAHPEVLQEASDRLQAKQASDDAAAQKRAEASLPRFRAAIERDPRDYVANPGGTITLTEFYDYRCPHCANAAAKVREIIADHPDVRVVFKEMPIFGAVSEHAAYGAMAVKASAGDYLGYYATLMSTHPLDNRTIDSIAAAKGAKVGDLAPSGPATAQLADTAALFKQLGLDGTPAFIIGDHIIEGEDMDAVTASIAEARGRR